jgi:hypothetical protein
MQGEKPESNENTYFQQLRQRKSLFHWREIGPIFDLTLVLSTACGSRGTIVRARLSFSPHGSQPRLETRPSPNLNPYFITSLLLYFLTSSAGILSIPIYGRKTSGTTTDPSAC